MASTAATQGDVIVAHHQVEKGLPFSEFAALKRESGLSQKELLAALRIPPRTLNRRRRGRFTPDESDRIVRVRRVFQLAANVLEGNDAARTWMRRPNLGLGQERPIALVTTTPGARAVEDAILRIRHGVYA